MSLPKALVLIGLALTVAMASLWITNSISYGDVLFLSLIHISEPTRPY